jgi:hypothetical protein
VWLASEPEVFPMTHDRRLPKRLKPDEAWETWIEESRVPLAWRGQKAFTSGRVRLSTGRVIHSKENKDVPRFGEIPGGS